MGRKRIPGLRKRGQIWWIDKKIKGRRIRESTGTCYLREAEQYLALRIEQERQASVYGVRIERTLTEAATKYLEENQHKRSIDRDGYALRHLIPVLGHLPLRKLHMGTLQPYIRTRLQSSVSQGTVNRELSLLRRILNLAARSWRDENDIPWLDSLPLIDIRSYEARKPYPLSWDQQCRLFSLLPAHLARMALFKVNTGCREKEVCRLRWEWEYRVPEFNTTVFIIPGEFVKNKHDRLVVLNSVAKSVVDSVRRAHHDFVFTYKGRPVHRMNNSAWKKWRVRAGIPMVRIHDLKHTFGHRLRAAGVSFEDRQDLLGHRSDRITTHYSAPDIGRLLKAAEKVVETRTEPVFQAVSHPKSPQSTALLAHSRL